MSDETPHGDRKHDDRKKFVPWHERLPWMRGIGNAIDSIELAGLVVLVAVFGVGGLVFWLCGGTPPW